MFVYNECECTVENDTNLYKHLILRPTSASANCQKKKTFAHSFYMNLIKRKIALNLLLFDYCINYINAVFITRGPP